MFEKKSIHSAVAYTVAVIAGLAGTVSATAEETAGWQLEEVVVTAQKREEKLSDVPIAVTALTSEQIGAAFANNIEDLQSMVPSVS